MSQRIAHHVMDLEQPNESTTNSDTSAANKTVCHLEKIFNDILIFSRTKNLSELRQIYKEYATLDVF